MDSFFVALLCIVTGGALALSLRQWFVRMKTAACLGTGAGCFLGLVTALVTLFQTETPEVSVSFLRAFSLSFRMDGLSCFFLIPIFAISMAAVIYSFHYMDKAEEKLKTAMSYVFFSLLIVSMALVVTAANMIAFMLAWEIMSLSSFFLVIHQYGSPENRRAGYLYLVFSHVGALFLFAAFGLLFSFTGSFEFGAAGLLPEGMKLGVLLLFLVGFGSKAGIFPLHIWLPHAHPAAPSHISAVMSGVMIKTGIYGLLRMYTHMQPDSLLFGEGILVLGMASGILGVVYALGQQDLKRLLAFSSVENIGIILIGMGVGMIGAASGSPVMAALGFAGCLFHVLNHAVFKSLLFMGAGMVIHKTGTARIDALGGLMKTLRLTGLAFLIGCLAISGLPLFNGFAGEFLIYSGAFKGLDLDRIAFLLSHFAIISLAIIGGLSLACFTKVMGVAFLGEPRGPQKKEMQEKEPAMVGTLCALAGACLLIGLAPDPFVRMALKAIEGLHPACSGVAAEPFLEMAGNIRMAAILFALLLGGLWGIRRLLYKEKPVTESGTWGCGFTQPTARIQYTGTSYAAAIVDFFRPVAPLSEDHPAVSGLFPEKTHFKSRINDIAEMHMDTFIVRPILALFDKLRWIQHGDIHLYVGYILLTILLLLFFV